MDVHCAEAAAACAAVGEFYGSASQETATASVVGGKRTTQCFSISRVKSVAAASCGAITALSVTRTWCVVTWLEEAPRSSRCATERCSFTEENQ
jgi:hypothetical protein